MYKPLPDSLTIKKSGINGIGLFADQDIKHGTNLGMSHVAIGSGIIRTPMGGFINLLMSVRFVIHHRRYNGPLTLPLLLYLSISLDSISLWQL